MISRNARPAEFMRDPNMSSAAPLPSNAGLSSGIEARGRGGADTDRISSKDMATVAPEKGEVLEEASAAAESRKICAGWTDGSGVRNFTKGVVRPGNDVSRGSAPDSDRVEVAGTALGPSNSFGSPFGVGNP